MSDDSPVILYLDDDQDYLDSMRAILEAEGYSMVEALTAEEGLEVFRKERPDLVLVDLMMEEVDSGTRFVKELKVLGSDVPIYLLSSVGDNLGTTTDYSTLGLTGVFQKPIHRKTLLTLLRAKLARSNRNDKTKES